MRCERPLSICRDIRQNAMYLRPLPRSDRYCPASTQSTRSKANDSASYSALSARAGDRARTAVAPLRSQLRSSGPAAPVALAAGGVGTYEQPNSFRSLPMLIFGTWERRLRRMSARLDGAAVPKAGAAEAPERQAASGRDVRPLQPSGTTETRARLRDNLRTRRRLTPKAKMLLTSLN